VWRAGLSAWVAAGSLAELSPIFTSPAPNAAQPAEPLPRDARLPSQQYAPPTEAGPVLRAENLMQEGIVYASFLRRIAAYLLDGLIYSLMAAVLVGMVVLCAGALTVVLGPTAALVGIAAVYVLPAVLFAFYHVVQESGPQRGTWGKRALGLRVLTADGRRLSFGQALGRFLLKVFLTIAMTASLGFLTILFTKRKQALHDLIVDTVVVKDS
jgi:uncharacterized RDD family membrane protein YckC